MANKRTETPVKKASSPRTPKATRKNVLPERRPTFLDYFKMSESYTSLILGIVVVIITSVLLIAFIRNRTHVAPQPTQDISTAIKIGPSISPVESPIDSVSRTITTTVSPTVKPTVVTPSPTAKPTAVPTVIAKAVTPTARPVVKPSAKVTPSVKNTRGAITYTTKAGDDLWAIAEKYYNSGYNWVDIAKANNISDANVIYAGMKLTIPRVEKKIATVTVTPAPTKAPTAMSNLGKSQLHAKTYTVKPGDDLWDVAVTIYNDGYRWTEIAKANNLTNPNVIHSGNVLKIP